jgi:hypothetical protein
MSAMKKTHKALALLAPAALLALPLLATAPATATAATPATYQANLTALNHATGSGTFMMQLNGSSATITEDVHGLAAKFSGAAYPHVQHIHINGQGACPATSADTNGDGVISTTEGGPAYGAIGTTLSVSGDTSPAAGTDVKIAPSGGDFHYARTITLDSATMASIKAGKAVIVVHGLDPTTLSTKAQGEKSDLVPALPLAATSPALCGPLEVSQMTQMPTGGANTGGGGTSGVQDPWLFGFGGAALLAAGGALLMRRRTVGQK